MNDVKINDIWQDLDPRKPGRRIKVLWIGDGHALVQNAIGTGARTKVRLDRMKPNGTGKRGYKLVERDGAAVGDGTSVAA